MSEESRIFTFEAGKQYSITFTCLTPGCINGVGEQNYEVVTFIDIFDIVTTMKCPTCGSDMQQSNVVVAGGVRKIIWT